MFKFVTHRPLWVNLITAVALAVVFFIVFILSLNFLTHHGRSRNVPLVVGKTFADAEKILDKEGFDIVIQDSVYVDTLPPLAILKQVPESDAVAKARVEPKGINLLVLSANGVTDTLNAYIVDQQPKRYNEEGEPLIIHTGQFINVKLATEKPVISDSANINQLPQ